MLNLPQGYGSYEMVSLDQTIKNLKKQFEFERKMCYEGSCVYVSMASLHDNALTHLLELQNKLSAAENINKLQQNENLMLRQTIKTLQDKLKTND